MFTPNTEKSNGKPAKQNGKTSRKSKAESSTGKKEATVEMRKGELELKQIELKADDFALHLRSTKSAVEKMKTAKNLYDSCCKAAKKVSPQLLEAVKLAIKIENKDMDEVRGALEVMGFVLRETDHPLQLTIHDTLLGDVLEAASKRGFADGRAGKPAANPYPEGTELARAYFSEWGRGQQDLLGIIADDGEDDDSVHAQSYREPATVQ